MRAGSTQTCCARRRGRRRACRRRSCAGRHRSWSRSPRRSSCSDTRLRASRRSGSDRREARTGGSMDADEMRLDGNAMAGMLGEVFVREMTAARVACGGCGAVEPVGAEHAYTQAPGVVMRCRHCDGVLLVVTQTDDAYRVGLGGARWVEFAGEA